MKPKRKDLSRVVTSDAEEDFPSLHPGKIALQAKTWDEKSDKSDADMNSTRGSLDEFPALFRTQKKAQNDTVS
jgi:hypothetical protein